jgi:hypothetical protein
MIILRATPQRTQYQRKEQSWSEKEDNMLLGTELITKNLRTDPIRGKNLLEDCSE